MGKNYRQLERTQHEKISLHYGWSSGQTARRKINRYRYQTQTYFKQLIRDYPDLDPKNYQPDHARYGKGLKLASTRRFVNFHQRNYF